jgi:hypothetical protein
MVIRVSIFSTYSLLLWAGAKQVAFCAVRPVELMTNTPFAFSHPLRVGTEQMKEVEMDSGVMIYMS